MKINLNGDQVLSLGNYAIAGLGAMMMGWGIDGDYTQAAVGMFAVGLSFVVAFWMNATNVYDIVLSIARRSLMVLAVLAIAKGWTTQETAVTIVNVILGAIPVIWSMWFYRDEPGPNLPGTTIVDPPKVSAADLEAQRELGRRAVPSAKPRDGTVLP